MNLLITSIGQRGYLVDHFKEAANGRFGIFGADAFKYAPALCKVDRAFVLPYAREKGYCEKLIQLCKENDIGAVFSINDLELPFLAKYKPELAKHGINAVISDKNVIDICTDKYLTYQYANKYGVGAPRTYLWTEKERILKDIAEGLLSYPIVAKPRRGSKSIGIHMLNNEEELLKDIEETSESDLPEDHKCLYQEKLDGVLIGAHVLCNKNHQPVSIVTMKNLTIHFGETYQNIAYHDLKLFEYVLNAVNHIGAYGIIDLNIMEKNDGTFALLEFNPRISGGYSLSHYSQPLFTKTLLRIANGEDVAQDFETMYNFKKIIMLKQFTSSWTTEEAIARDVIEYI
jgi:carbamoyl-phosphate synthase large subunit